MKKTFLILTLMTLLACDKKKVEPSGPNILKRTLLLSFDKGENNTTISKYNIEAGTQSQQEDYSAFSDGIKFYVYHSNALYPLPYKSLGDPLTNKPPFTLSYALLNDGTNKTKFFLTDDNNTNPLPYDTVFKIQAVIFKHY